MGLLTYLVSCCLTRLVALFIALRLLYNLSEAVPTTRIGGRVITRLQFPPALLLRLNVWAYVDDVFAGEPAAFVNSGFRAFKALTSILKFHTSDKKGQPPWRAHLPFGRCRDCQA